MTPEEEICSRNALARALGTTPATATNIAGWNSVVAVATDGTPITRDKLDDVMRRFPTPAAGALGSPEPEDPGYHLLHRTTGRPATTSRSPRPKLIGFSTLSHSMQPVPHLDLSRLDHIMGPQRSWQEVVQLWRSQQLERAQEVQATHRRRVVESRRSLATRAKKTCSQLSTPSSD
jgi:hypothetical protein